MKIIMKNNNNGIIIIMLKWKIIKILIIMK